MEFALLSILVLVVGASVVASKFTDDGVKPVYLRKLKAHS